jgi:hypothetical protein
MKNANVRAINRAIQTGGMVYWSHNPQPGADVTQKRRVTRARSRKGQLQLKTLSDGKWNTPAEADSTDILGGN